MARLKKNGNLSGAIGNIVFVNDGDRSYVRGRANKVNQTVNTQASSSEFGSVSTKEKQLRLIMKEQLGLITPQYFSSRNAARLRKTVTQNKGDNKNSITEFQDPTALVGFDFNSKMQWERCTNFFPAIGTDEDNRLTVAIPAITWGREIKPPKSADLATINLHAITTDLNQDDVSVELLSSLSLAIKVKETATP